MLFLDSAQYFRFSYVWIRYRKSREKKKEEEEEEEKEEEEEEEEWKKEIVW
jgi:hypothetical protein